MLFVPRRPHPEHLPLRQLENRHGFRLAITPEGRVRGVRGDGGGEDDKRLTVLEFSPSVPPGAFRIKGVETGY